MLNTYRRLLVAVDGSQASLHALEEVCRLAPASLLVAAVAPPWPASPGGKTLPALSLESASQALEKAAALARAFNCDIDTATLGGQAHERLVALARERDCDVIVMGRKGAARPDKALMGSTVARVIGFAPVDVLVVPLDGKLGFGRILCPLDGSRFSRAALERALALTAEQKGELLAISILDAPAGFACEVPQVARELLAGLEGLVGGARRQAEARGVACRTWVHQGSAYRTIVEVAGQEQADLIVLGSHGRTGIKRLLMGSVAERVIGYASSPVLVVKPKR